MPSINEVQRLFLSQVVPEERDIICDRDWLDDNTDVSNVKICDEMFGMLICAYIELILPILTIGGSFLFKNDAKHIWGSNLPGLGCITAGSIYLALYYGGKLSPQIKIKRLNKRKCPKISVDMKVPQLIKLSDNFDMSADTHMMFKAHVGIAIGMCMIGALLMIQVTLSFIGVLMCGNCCSGERAVGLFAYIFTMIGKNFSHSLKIKYLFQFQVWPLSSVFQLDPWLLVGLTLLVIALMEKPSNELNRHLPSVLR